MSESKTKETKPAEENEDAPDTSELKAKAAAEAEEMTGRGFRSTPYSYEPTQSTRRVA